MAQRQLSQQKRRGLRFMRLYLLQCSSSTLTILLLFGVLTLVSGMALVSFFQAFTVITLLIWIVQIPLTFLLTRFWSYRVLPTGIEGPDFWGNRRTLAWEEIVAAPKKRFMGHEYLVPRSRKGHEVWISSLRYIEDAPQMLEEMFTYIPVDNPLRQGILNGE